ncbi:MAG TPA: DUF4384 domain-containing protein, partial [Pyrinomonadaceae bacterium]
MKVIVPLFGLLCVAIAISALPIVDQDQEDVRGAFLTSRPKDKPATSSSTTSRPSHRRPRPSTDKNPSSADNKNTNSGNKNSNASTPNNSNKPAPVNAQRLGLGLTLFMRDSNGLAVRTDPSRVFQKGDRVRVLLETNSDGYLYIFNTTNDGPPTMIYPDADLDEAGN